MKEAFDYSHPAILTLKNGLYVLLGYPQMRGGFMVISHGAPSVFPVAEVKIELPHLRPKILHDLTVLVGHGMHTDGRRLFTNGMDIASTIDAYNANAAVNGRGGVDAVFACDHISGIQPLIRISNFAVPVYNFGDMPAISNYPVRGGGMGLRVEAESQIIGVR